jgi:cytoskeletal protein CcmA (bactofilin family)|tara:strand:+ start:149 stop:541 length:393 start_codon:yes stop_codon:yes gene_type:complete
MTSKKSRDAATSLVAAGTFLSGDITFCNELVIAGTVNGSVTSTGNNDSIVKILEGGKFTGEILAPKIEISGQVEANITGTASVSIGPKANVSGVIRFLKLAVSPGATISGELITMDEQVEDNVVENQTTT